MTDRAQERRGVHVPVWVFVSVGGVLLFLVAFAIGRRSERRDFDGGRFGEHGGRHGLGVLLLVLVLALVVAGIVLAVRHFSGGGNANRDRATRSAMLAQRFAAGRDRRSRVPQPARHPPGVDRAAVHRGHYGGAGAPLA